MGVGVCMAGAWMLDRVEEEASPAAPDAKDGCPPLSMTLNSVCILFPTRASDRQETLLLRYYLIFPVFSVSRKPDPVRVSTY